METLRIDIICNDGSPLGVSSQDIYGHGSRIGVGGAEQALLTMCEAWTKEGHVVTLYNNPIDSTGSIFSQRDLNYFNPQADRDILIIFRSPNPRCFGAKGKKVWWSCDQRTVGDFREFAKSVDKIVTISEFHSEFFESMYGIFDTIPIDLPVRGWDYDKYSFEKVSKQCLFSSVPDRGLDVLSVLWPKIVERVPEASLVITSGWSLWTGQPDNHLLQSYRQMFGTSKNVNYLGAVPRAQLIALQMSSDLFLFPCTYDELFCIAASEAQWAGAWPITSNTGALRTTNMGTVIVGSPRDSIWRECFVDQVVAKLQADNLSNIQKMISEKAHERFNIQKVMDQWQTSVFS